MDFDLRLLDDKTDSKYTCLHVKVKNLSRDDIDFEKVSMLGYSQSSINDWLRGKNSIPLSVLKSFNLLADRIEFMKLRASHIKELPQNNMPKFKY